MIGNQIICHTIEGDKRMTTIILNAIGLEKHENKII